MFFVIVIVHNRLKSISICWAKYLVLLVSLIQLGNIHKQRLLCFWFQYPHSYCRPNFYPKSCLKIPFLTLPPSPQRRRRLWMAPWFFCTSACWFCKNMEIALAKKSANAFCHSYHSHKLTSDFNMEGKIFLKIATTLRY